MAAILASTVAADAKVIYVNGAQTSIGDGTTWAKAFTFLRDALDASVAGDAIYVAKGIYYPDEGTSGFIGDRELSFNPSNVTIYGGFAGTEKSPGERVVDSNETVLTGEIWDEAEYGNTYASLHVMVLKGNCTLDGLTIEKGNASGRPETNDQANQGGGCLAPSGTTLTVNNCIFNLNGSRDSGGAVWGKVIATNSTFSNNAVINFRPFEPTKTWDLSGGAIAGDVIATDCVFSDNIIDATPNNSVKPGTSHTASGEGGAIAGAKITATRCVFQNNAVFSTGFDLAEGKGGAVSGTLTAKFCTFTNNVVDSLSVDEAGAIGGAAAGVVTATNCSFEGNNTTGASAETTVAGGALHLTGVSPITNCVFISNTVQEDDPGFGDTSRGGAIFIDDSGSITVSDSTFLDNAVTLILNQSNPHKSGGAAICCNGNVFILNNIFWCTADADADDRNQSNLINILDQSGGTVSGRSYPTPSTVTFNIVAGGIDGITGESGALFTYPDYHYILDSDPDTLFADVSNPAGIDGVLGTADDGLRLGSASLAIGLARTLFMPLDILDIDYDNDLLEKLPADFANFERIQDSVMDLGAYEYGNLLHLPEITISQPSNVALVDEVSSIDFGTLPGVAVTKVFTVKNIGRANLNNLSVQIDGLNSSSFVIAQPSVTSVTPGGSATFSVTLKASTGGLKSAAIHVVSNDADENTFDIELTGNVLVADIAVEQPVNTNLVDGVSTINFSTTAVYSSTAKTFTIRNTGQTTLKIASIVPVGDFQVSGLASTNVVPGGTTTFVVKFIPKFAGARTGGIFINSNDPDSESVFSVKFTGNGFAAPEIAVYQAYTSEVNDGQSINYGAVKKGLLYTKTFTIKNIGSLTLKKIAVSLTGSSNFSYVSPPVNELEPGAKANFTVTFKPTALGVRTSLLKIVSTDADENPFDLALSGTGVSATTSGTSPTTFLQASALTSDTSASLCQEPGIVTIRTAEDGKKYLVLTVQKAPGWELTRHRVEVSSNLQDWFSGPTYTTVLTNSPTVLRVRDNKPLVEGRKRYIRLR